MTRKALLAALLLASPVRAPAADSGGAKTELQGLQRITVRPGDTLWGIAQTYLKDPTRWNEILRYNKLPTSDPTVALPGTTLNVPVELIKEELRAAMLIYVLRQVLYRKSETADWKEAEVKMQLYRGDGLRTLAESRARVEFTNKAVLSLEADSMAILKPPKQEDHDLRLMRGGIQATTARVLTPSALVTPKAQGTKYLARVLDDLSTRVQVLKGKAEVAGGGKKVEVLGGFATDVPLDRAPSPPAKIPNLAALEAEMSESALGQLATAARPTSIVVRRGLDAPDVGSVSALQQEISSLSMGAPVAAYHVQVSPSEDFRKIAYEKIYDADAPDSKKFDLRDSGLPKGAYWVRVSIVDLLGADGEFSKPKLYRIGY